MKKQLVIAVLALLTSVSSLFAIKHNLKENGLVEGLNRIYATTENPNDLAPIIKKYYELAQQGQFDIPFEDFRKLHKEVSFLLRKESKAIFGR